MFDGQHILILCCLTDKRNNRIKALIWMMKQYISFSNLFKNISVCPKFLIHLRNIRFFFIFLKSLQTIAFHEEGKIKRTADGIHIIRMHLQLFFHIFDQTLVHFLFVFKLDDFSPLTFFQLLFDFFEQIFRIIFINGKIGIAHDSISAGAKNLVIQEKFIQEMFDQAFQ